MNILADVPGVQAFSAPGFSKPCYMEVSLTLHLHRRPKGTLEEMGFRQMGFFYLKGSCCSSQKPSLVASVSSKACCSTFESLLADCGPWAEVLVQLN